MHQSGLFLQLATKHGVHNEYLLEQNKLWSQEPCRSLTVFDNTCLIPAGDNTDRPSPISAGFQAFNELLVKYSVKPVKFPMFTGDSALGWFLQGLQVTLILVAGSLLSPIPVASQIYSGLNYGRESYYPSGFKGISIVGGGVSKLGVQAVNAVSEDEEVDLIKVMQGINETSAIFTMGGGAQIDIFLKALKEQMEGSEPAPIDFILKPAKK
jgi:hypothetical protein